MHVIRHDFTTGKQSLVPIVEAVEQIAHDRFPGMAIGYWAMRKELTDRLLAGEPVEFGGIKFFVEDGK